MPATAHPHPLHIVARRLQAGGRAGARGILHARGVHSHGSTDTQGKRALRVAAPFLRLHCDLAYALQKPANDSRLFQEIERMFWVEAPFLGMDGGLRRRGCDGRRCPLLDEGQRGRERFERSDGERLRSEPSIGLYILGAKCLP